MFAFLPLTHNHQEMPLLKDVLSSAKSTRDTNKKGVGKKSKI